MRYKSHPMGMKFKSQALPAPSKGVKGGRPKLVVPDQSMSLKEILQRFVRKEPLPVSHRGSFGSEGEIDPESDSEFNIDQEKAKSWDLTEKQEFADKVRAKHAEHHALEQDKLRKQKVQAELKAKEDYDKRVRIEARKLAKKAGQKPPSI